MSIFRFVVFVGKRTLYHCSYVSELKNFLDYYPLQCYDFDIVMESLLLNHEYQLIDLEGNEQLRILLTNS